ncbi:MAG: DUF3253 domain-containing protein [Pseudomonadota bacterium]
MRGTLTIERDGNPHSSSAHRLNGQVRETILELAQSRAPKSICPSEVARVLEADEAGWRALMPQVRLIAKHLVGEGAIVVTQRGRPVDPIDARGPIRIAMASGPAED